MKAKILGLAGCILFMAAANVQAKLVVLSSIKPLTLIAQEIVGDTAETDTLLPITASPHDYPLKASDHTRLQKANVILWVGPELESFLQKPISNVPSERVITAYSLVGLNWPADEHQSTQAHHHERDPHLWLDPRNAVVVARALNDKLAQIDPANKAKFDTNLQLFVVKMSQLDKKLTEILKPLAGRGFAVYHEGYGHFVSHYGLHQLDYVTFTPEQRPGAKHLQELRAVLSKEGKCLFLEPYNEQQSVRDLAVELNLHAGVLDALGSQSVNTYSQLLENMTGAFTACLGGRG